MEAFCVCVRAHEMLMRTKVSEPGTFGMHVRKCIDLTDKLRERHPGTFCARV